MTLVKMYRIRGDVTETADVHPDEVHNYQMGDWLLASPVPVVESAQTVHAVTEEPEPAPKAKRPSRSKADALNR